MTTADLLLKEIRETPEPILAEVYHYIRFLKEHAEEERFDGLALSESALKGDWTSPEEDEAWKNL